MKLLTGSRGEPQGGRADALCRIPDDPAEVTDYARYLLEVTAATKALHLAIEQRRYDDAKRHATTIGDAAWELNLLIDKLLEAP